MPLSDIFLRSLDPEWKRDIASYTSGPVMSRDKAFDKAANDVNSGYIGTGNVISPVQTSSYVRAMSANAKMHDHDMSTFAPEVRGTIGAHATEDQVIGYQFNVPVAGGRKPAAVVVTDVHGRLLEAKALPVPRHDTEAILASVVRRVSWTDAVLVDPFDCHRIAGETLSLSDDEAHAAIDAAGWDVKLNMFDEFVATCRKDPEGWTVSADSVQEVLCRLTVREALKNMDASPDTETPEP